MNDKSDVSFSAGILVGVFFSLILAVMFFKANNHLTPKKTWVCEEYDGEECVLYSRIRANSNKLDLTN